MPSSRINRRGVLKTAAHAAVAGGLSQGILSRSRLIAAPATSDKDSRAVRSVAAVVTIYRHGSHSDVILGKILEGWKQDGGVGPALKLASLYVDQFGDGDMARPMAKKYGVPIFDTIAGAVTVGTSGIPVDGVLSIGEHGDYPFNDKGQHLYPRRRFFAEIADTFEKIGRVVPVFNDKHLGPQWEDARWMYERAKSLKIPFMAGSSLPVGYRSPDIDIPVGSDIEAAVGIGYDGLDVYGFHALECYQCIVERRKGGERGVRSIEVLKGPKLWEFVDSDAPLKSLFEAALAGVPHAPEAGIRRDDGIVLIRIHYIDGFTGYQFLMNRSASLNGIAVKLRNQAQPLVCQFEERTEPRHPHFAWLTKAIEAMVHSGTPTYPVERTYLTGGILDRALTLLAENQSRRETPELAIAYQPVGYPHAPVPALTKPPISARS